MSLVGNKAHAETIRCDIAVENDDGVTIYYRWTNNKTELEVFCNNTSINNSYTGNVVIPSHVNYEGTVYNVTSIGNYAFRNCPNLASVTIPNSITLIGYSAFQNCTGLTSVAIPNSVTTIGNYAFKGCGLASISIPSSVTTIGSYAFENCYHLTSITIPNSVTSIGYDAFSGCSNLQKVIVPDLAAWCKIVFESSYYYNSNPLNIAHHLYSDENNEITHLIIPEGVTSINAIAFVGCSNLKSVIIPNSVTTIERDSFKDCRNIASFTVGAGVLTINNPFSNDSYLYYKPKKVIWLTNTPPSGYYNAQGQVNYVANELYTGLNEMTVYPFLSSIFEVDGVRYVPISPSERTCDAIDCLYNESAENIILGETVTYKGVNMSVKHVNKYALFGNSYLKQAEINYQGPIEDYTFSGCTNLSQVSIGDGITDIGRYAFSDCSSIENIIIPNVINTIEENAFNSCSALLKIEIPQSVNTIKNYVFFGCESLKTVIIDDDPDTTLELGNNGSDPLFTDCPLDSVYIGRNISYNT